MINSKTFSLPFRRKREGRTYYKKRLKILVSSRYRFVVRKSLRNIHASIVKYSPEGDKVLVTVSSSSLAKMGWKGGTGNLPSAYLTGFLLSKKAQKKNIKKAITDIGLQSITKGSVLFSCVKGAIDGGLDVPYSDDLMPPQDRIQGKHIKSATPFQETKTKIEASFKK